jgi:hypothetical protein
VCGGKPVARATASDRLVGSPNTARGSRRSLCVPTLRSSSPKTAAILALSRCVALQLHAEEVLHSAGRSSYLDAAFRDASPHHFQAGLADRILHRLDVRRVSTVCREELGVTYSCRPDAAVVDVRKGRRLRILPDINGDVNPFFWIEITKRASAGNGHALAHRKRDVLLGILGAFHLMILSSGVVWQRPSASE